MVSPNSTTPKNALKAGLATAITGSEAATWPAWNALWLTINPMIETATNT